MAWRDQLALRSRMPLGEWTRRLGALLAEAYDCFMVGTYTGSTGYKRGSRAIARGQRQAPLGSSRAQPTRSPAACRRACVRQGRALLPGFQPYQGKPAVRNDREGRGSVGIIRSPNRASTLPDCRGARGNSHPYRERPYLLHLLTAIFDAVDGSSGRHVSAIEVRPLGLPGFGGAEKRSRCDYAVGKSI
jgi:hypothetical protein